MNRLLANDCLGLLIESQAHEILSSGYVFSRVHSPKEPDPTRITGTLNSSSGNGRLKIHCSPRRSPCSLVATSSAMTASLRNPSLPQACNIVLCAVTHIERQAYSSSWTSRLKIHPRTPVQPLRPRPANTFSSFMQDEHTNRQSAVRTFGPAIRQTNSLFNRYWKCPKKSVIAQFPPPSLTR